MARRVMPTWTGMEPNVYGPLQDGTHGSAFTGMWHARQLAAWRKAWESCLIGQVRWHEDNLFTVPSQTREDKWYVVRRYPLAPDGYLYICDCAASERGGVVCAHGMAVYLWRLRHFLGWRLKRPSDRREEDTVKTA